MTKRAVVVGINNYMVLDPTGQSNLNHCVADARSVYYLLQDAFGFTEIYYYENLRASRNQILAALRHVLAISEAGDTVCFYFSGHGARIRAELTQADCDTYYEALVPASGSWITDRDLAQLADHLEPDYVNFTVITDACHSGGLHLADVNLKVRCPTYNSALIQTIIRFLHTLIPCGICLPLNSSALQGNVSNVRPGQNSSIDLDADPDKTLVAVTKATLLSACRFNEFSWESRAYQHGLFTQSILSTMSQSGFGASYHTVLEQLRNQVKQRIETVIRPQHPGVMQTPQLFGQRNRMPEEFLAGWRSTPATP